MAIASWRRAKQIFHEALDRPESDRSGFVAAECGDDEQLRSEVEGLLTAHLEAGQFLASPTMGGATDAAEAAARDVATGGLPEGAGSRIGPYKILQLIGEGGFGSVYMADQEHPIRRRVALKIIKLGMDTKEVIARFEAERQALAMMDHPNIAKVLDAGATESGRPYFVMELVKGVPITEYCDTQRLSTRERLELFVDVCKAVQHAHANGIIHRDVKPSNVMVTLHDGTPVPKVIDFGVAKATNHRLTEKTLFTAYGEFIGTPAYMSPEQAEMSGLEVDRRSDLYSLGVLLYELLTGTTPFETGVLRSAAFVEVLRILREDDPPTPSDRLNTLGDRLSEVAMRRQVDPHMLTKLLRGDLDWIVMKAMEKDRTRRYDSASDLAADVARHFKHEPVTARRPSAVYRLRKFTKRRRGALVGAAALVATVLLGGALSQFGAPALGTSEPGPPAKRLILATAGNFNTTLPTRDGNHLLRYNVEGRGYELLEIESGRTRQLTSAGPDPDGRLFVNHKLAPDGRLIAAVHLVSADVDQDPDITNDGGRELRTFTVGDEGEGQILFRWEPGHHVQVFGWAPDQTRIWVFVIRPDQAAEIASVDVTDGSIEVLKTLVWRGVTQPPSLSPDGRFITYHNADSRDARPDIFILASDGSRETRVEHPASDSKPLFAPDGSGIVFRSRRGGGDLWFLPVTDGRPAGEPRAVWDDISPYGTATLFADNGSLFYFFATNGWEIYTADIRLADGTLVEPQHIPARPGEVHNAPAFSPDGRFLAHLRGGRRLVLRELTTNIEREFPLSGSLGVAAIDFCASGREVLAGGYRTEPVVFRVDLDHGGTERLPIDDASRAVCVGDNEVVYLRGTDPNNFTQVEIVRRSLSTGRETNLYEGRAVPYVLQRSADGSHIAFVALGDVEAQLLAMPSRGGPAVPIATSPISRTVWTEFHGIMWMPSGRAILVARAPFADDDETSPEITFWRMPLDGTPPEQMGRMELPAFERAYVGSLNYSLHPDGSRITFERHAGLVSQRWAIDNLLQFIQSGATAPVADPRR